MSLAVERGHETYAPIETDPTTAEELEARVLELGHALDEPDGDLYEAFRGPQGIKPTDMIRADRPAGGHTLLVKNETMHTATIDGHQVNAGAFKIRGAYAATTVAVRNNPLLERVRCASAGNHAIGVALAAKSLGLEAHVYCKSDISPAKETVLKSLGTLLHKNDPTQPEMNTLAHAMERGMAACTPTRGELTDHFVHPFNQVEVIAGQYTVGREIVQDLVARAEIGELDVHQDPIEVLCTVGGGGLAAGVAIAIKEAKDMGVLGANVRVVCARVEGGRDNVRCDGTATDIGELPQLLLEDKRYVEGIKEITNVELADAMFELTGIFNKKAEPAGSLSYALAKKRAAAQGPPRAATKPTTYVSIFTGANTSNESYDYYMSLRDAVYHGNLARLGERAMTTVSLGVDTVSARETQGKMLGGRVLR